MAPYDLGRPRRDAERLFRSYMGIAKTIVPTTATEQAIRTIVGSSTVAIPPEMVARGVKDVYEFREVEFYYRFEEIIRAAIDLVDVPRILFNYMDIRNYRAVSQRVDDDPMVFVDGDLIDFWFAFWTFRLVETYVASNDDDRQELDQLAIRQIESLVQGKRLFRESELDRRYLVSHNQHLIGIGASLSRVTAYFVLAHEIAHHCLDHHSHDETYQAELEADGLGADIFSRLRQKQDLKWASVPAGYLGTPILFFELLNSTRLIGDQLRGSRALESGYPNPKTRRSRVMAHLPTMSDHDVSLLRDLRMSMIRLNLSAARTSQSNSVRRS